MIELTDFRRKLIECIPLGRTLLARRPHTAFVWPTERCSIACAHCNFASGHNGHELAAIDIPVLSAWLVASGTKRVVLCGGGEPLDKPDLCEEIIGTLARTGMGLGVYTSGTSLVAPRKPSDVIASWLSLLRDDQSLHVRLSVDKFHQLRLGIDPVVEWILGIKSVAPHWRITLRGLRVCGDASLQHVARELNADIQRHRYESLKLPDGSEIPVERMGYVVDGRASIGLLSRFGLALPQPDSEQVGIFEAATKGRQRSLGRPLSRRLTVGPKRLDLEIKSDSIVHILESQPADNRASFLSSSWQRMYRDYSRDPLINQVAAFGLPGISTLLLQAIKDGVAPVQTVPASLERCDRLPLLDWLSAMSTLAQRNLRSQTAESVSIAESYLSS